MEVTTPKEKPKTDKELLDQLGGDPLEGSGFEEETPEDGFAEE